MMAFTECPDAQGTEGWLRARMGRVTGSKAKDVLASIKSGEAAARRDYRVALMLERLTGNPTPQGFVSDEMKWGTVTEPLARMAYEARTGNIEIRLFSELDEVLGDASGATGVRMVVDASRQVTGTAGDTQVEGARTFATLAAAALRSCRVRLAGNPGQRFSSTACSSHCTSVA